MALTVCAYCDKTFLETKPHCPHCGMAQMDLVVQAGELADRLIAQRRTEEVSMEMYHQLRKRGLLSLLEKLSPAE